MSGGINDMKRVSKNDIDLRPWEFFESDDATGLRDILSMGFAAQITNTIRGEFEKDPPSLWLPTMWRTSDGIGGECPDDPLMVYVSLALGESDDGVVYGISLEAAIDDLIDGIENPQAKGKVTGKEECDTCAKLAQRLRELADKVDAACEMDDNETSQ